MVYKIDQFSPAYTMADGFDTPIEMDYLLSMRFEHGCRVMDRKASGCVWL